MRKPYKKPLLLIGAVLAFSLGVFFACSDNDNPTSPSSSLSQNATTGVMVGGVIAATSDTGLVPPSSLKAARIVQNQKLTSPNRIGTYGVPNLTVQLVRDTTIIASATTDSNGSVVFTNVPQGSYSIIVQSSPASKLVSQQLFDPPPLNLSINGVVVSNAPISFFLGIGQVNNELTASAWLYNTSDPINPVPLGLGSFPVIDIPTLQPLPEFQSPQKEELEEELEEKLEDERRELLKQLCTNPSMLELQHYSSALKPMGSTFEVASILAWYQWQ